MSVSPSRRQPLDVGHIGIAREQLPPLDAGPVDWRAWFEQPGQPVDLEIGSGKGTFLVQQARRCPQVNYLGLEYARAFWRYAADRCRRHGLENVRLIHDEADSFVRHRLPDRSIRQVHIYFPDPWPKKRHHKRRLIQAPFLRELNRVLVDPHIAPHIGDIEAGQVRLATDHVDYFAWMQEHVAKVSDLFERRPFEAPQSAEEGEFVGTNFERKYRRENRTIQGMVLRKRVAASG